MNPIFLKKYDDIIVSVITTNNKVVNQDKQIVKFGPKLFISIKGPTVERLKIEEKLKEFMLLSIFHPLLIRAFFSDTILTWDEFLKISENENAKDVFIIFMDIVDSFKSNFRNLDLSMNEKILSFSNILATIFPDEDYDFGEIFPQNKSTESLLLILDQIQDMIYNVFEIFYCCFFDVVKDKSAEDFKSGTCEEYLNLTINHQTVKIGFFKRCYEQIINKSLDICFDNYKYFDFKSSELEDKITHYQKFLDEEYSDLTIYKNFLPELIKKVRHISSGDAVKDAEKIEISELKTYLRSLIYPDSKFLNQNLWICMDGALNDDDIEMLEIFLEKSNCKEEDWSDKEYLEYTLENFNPEFKEYKHKTSKQILNYQCGLLYCKNGFKYGDCTHATSKERTCRSLHCEGFRLNIFEKYVVLEEDLENETDGSIFYNKEISEKIFEAVRTNFPEHDNIYQLCENGKNTLYLFSGRIGKYTYVYTVPPKESEVIDCPSEITCNESSKKDNLKNSFNQLSRESEVVDYPSEITCNESSKNDNSFKNSFNKLSSETHQESVNSTSSNQEVEKYTSSSKGYCINFFGDDDDSDDEDNTCESVQIDNVWETSERLQTIVDDEEEDVQDEVPDEEEYVQDEVPDEEEDVQDEVPDEEEDVQDEVPDEVPDENQSIVSEVSSTLETIRDVSIVSSSSTKNSIPYIYFRDTKVFFNKPTQRLISDGNLVEVLKYAGNNMVKCRKGNEIIICDPLEEFVNFKKFAEHCNKKYEERKKKMHPKKEKVKKNFNSGKVVTKDISFLSVVSNSIEKSTSSGVSSSSVVPSDKENAKDFQSLEASKDIPKNVEKSLPNLNPCSHYLSKGVCRYNEKCKFDHVTFCDQFYIHGVCNDNCGNYHPEELKKLLEKYRYVSRTLGQSGDFYGYWKKLYIPEICRAKYVNDCKYKNCKRFHYKSTK